MAKKLFEMILCASACLSMSVSASGGTSRKGVNPWKSASHPIPKYVFEERSPPATQDTRAMYRDLVEFPTDFSRLVWPTTNPWVKGTRAARAKDFGWNADDATECLRKACSSSARIVILDKMEGPWRVTSVNPGSNKTLVFAKGVMVTGTQESRLSGTKDPLFLLKDVEDVFFLGEGDNYIGRYTEKDEIGRNQDRKYNGDGFSIHGARNVALKNLVIANNGNDGACVSGHRKPSKSIWFEDCVFHRNTRQGVSIVSADGVYFKNCVFSDTCGLPPKCGLDIEPWLPTLNVTANIYLLGCTFRNNRGGDLQFSTSSLWPVTFYAKDCVFEPNIAGNLGITQRVLYPQFQTDAPSDIIFEDCLFKGMPGTSPIRFWHGNFFHVTFRGCEIKEQKGMRRAPVPPIKFLLEREFRCEKDDSPVPRPVPEGSVTFENFKISGFNGVEPVAVEDKVGLCSVKNLFGTIVMGRKLDAAKYRYELSEDGGAGPAAKTNKKRR